MKPVYGKNFKLGILGGGQLGRMLIQEAASLDVQIHVLDPTPDAPCAELANSFTCGEFRDYDTVMKFGADKDLITIEIEDVNTQALKDLQAQGLKVCPDPTHLEIIKDKGIQKQFYADHNIATSDFRLIESGKELTADDLPCVLKARTGGYDGKGVAVLRSADDLAKAFDGPCVVEDLVDIEKELSVIIARNEQGETKAFPVVELVFDPVANLVDYLFAPANIADDVAASAEKLAMQVADALEFRGIIAIEMFLTTSGEVLVNEAAPRTHNSGHHSIEGNICSQFEQHLRSVLNLPLGSTETLRPAAMVNLVGAEGYTGPVKYVGFDQLLAMPGVYPHIYGKSTTKPYRKMGHVTILADSVDALKGKVAEVKNAISVQA
ncbi:MAG: 5-(carboxyamino)imidazole ribonucleotide synthase [Flavobacteriales bacterium]|nr:5-(carboxyamino)imidazole ribonucleotide synthase [Flavobacteriales bacterium]